MHLNSKRAALFLLSVMIAGPALAENTVVASCTGSGATFLLSEVSADRLPDYGIFEPQPTPDAILVIDRRKGGTTHWDTRSRREIARDCGGKDDDLALFPGIQPKSGLWQAELGETRLNGCPAMMQQAFPSAPGALPAEWKAPRRVTFEIPFHPDQLEMTRSFEAGMNSKVAWRQVADDTWQTEIFPELFGQMPSGQGKGSNMTWRMTIRSENRIEHDTTLNIALPAEAAAVLGSGEDCRMTSHNIWQRVGD